MEEPHYVISLGTGWHSEPYKTHADAQAWIDAYRVSQEYKDANYRVVSVREYWQRHRKPK